MAVKALRLTRNTLHHTYQAAGTITANLPVKFSSTDLTIVTTTTADDALAIGVAKHGGSSGDDIEIYLYGHSVIPVKVGTGDCTRGTKVRWVSDGVTDAPANGGGTTAHTIAGQVLQSGVAGDVVGLMIGGAFGQGSAT